MKPKYYLSQTGEFVIENYNLTKPFANFFPGIAGKYGIPMWTFYVNRNQAISSFGTKDKDHAILEFFPANKSWQLTSALGFRTFIKIFSNKKTIFYEPFQDRLMNQMFNITNKMSITSYDLKLEESNLSLGLKLNVEYFTIPNDNYAALVRIVTLKNLTKTTKNIQLLDGLSQIVAFGISNLFLKKLGRTVEAWINVENLERGVPYYKLDVDPTDRPEVIRIKEGNFYLGFHYIGERPKVVKPIIAPENIFGQIRDFSYPSQFLNTKNFLPPKEIPTKNKTPCGFLFFNLKLLPNQEKVFYSLIGYMHSKQMLNSSLSKIIAPGYISEKREENKKFIEELQSDINTKSSSKEFDLYAKQTYLDNILRGGYPVIFKSNTSPKVFYLYCRKHGDLERDYNKFSLSPTYFSQGNGNYRDLNQNRRSDVWFNPQIQDENIITLFNLLQVDGFNPLVIKGLNFTLKNPTDFKIKLKDLVKEKYIADIISFLTAASFTPGEVIFYLEQNKIKLNVSYDEFLNLLLSNSSKHQEAEHGEGFWIDHWHYNLDQLESYLGIYPEKLKETFLENRVFTFYDNTEVVKPRREKYLLKDGLVRQLHSLHPDNAKRQMIRKRAVEPHVVRTDYGKGEIYHTTLLNKLLCLLVNKLASLDPFGCGIEMEADKPNWFDALNGLPGLFGSSLCETFELKRLILIIKNALERSQPEKVYITEEVYEFLIKLDNLRNCPLTTNADYQYWDKSYSLKEDYRQKTRFGFSGKESEIKTDELIQILNNALSKVDMAIDKARDKEKNVYYTYFINEVVEYETLKSPYVFPTKFRQIKLPIFLESQMHALRLSENINNSKKIYQGTKNSQLYDRKLKMYKVTAPLTDAPLEIGRCRVFSPGWLENESIWLHMEYKYILEVLKQGLYKEFYADFKNVLIPFQKPQKYGRSILENSSFIVSSAFKDKNLQGTGFVARLSGSTAEFLNIWLIMNLGQRPFFLNENGQLNLSFKPILAGWLFDRKGIYAFNFLSKIWVAYHNPKRKDTFGKNAVRVKRIAFNDKDGNPIEILSDTIPQPYALHIRSCQIKKIDIYLD